jgi:hypothetical protein
MLKKVALLCLSVGAEHIRTTVPTTGLNEKLNRPESPFETEEAAA